MRYRGGQLDVPSAAAISFYLFDLGFASVFAIPNTIYGYDLRRGNKLQKPETGCFGSRGLSEPEPGCPWSAMASMNLISRADLDRIISSVEGNQSTEFCDVPRREKLKQISDSRVAGWKDTLAATRKAKIEWKAEKARQDEEKRKALDAEEAVIREKQRRETLSHADQLLREQTEKRRQFRSQQMLVETLDTRDSQIKDKEQRRIREIEAERVHHNKIMTNIQEAEKKALAKAEVDARKSKELADDLQRQRDQRAELIRTQNQRKRAEEEALIRKIAMDEAAAEQLEAQLKNDRRMKTKEEIRSNEILLKTRREQLQNKEQELIDKCEEEVRRQNRINAARLALEEKHFEEKQAMRKILSDRASEDLRQRAMREFEIFERDQKMRYQKEIEKAEATRKKQELDKMALDQTRKKQIKHKKEQVEADRELSKLYADQLNKVTLERQELERQKELIKRQQNVEVRMAQEQQCQENHKRREEERLAVLQQEQKVIQANKKEDDIFKEFVAREIENFKFQGKRTALLEKTLNV